MTPNVLIPALRQYQHNDCSGLLAGFDYEETINIVKYLQSNIYLLTVDCDRLRSELDKVNGVIR